MRSPVTLIVFKRLDSTKKVIGALRIAAPEKIYIIADGWRNEMEKEKCLAVREYLEKAVDWPCTVKKNYSDVNLGTKKRIVSGLDWVFEHEEESVILEDDCVPEQSFFRFCDELLERYRYEPRIMQISGLNIQQDNKDFSTGGASYYFSRYPEIWGWATWRRAWKLFDSTMSTWPTLQNTGELKKRLGDAAAADYWGYLFDHVRAAGDDRTKSDVWGVQWVFALIAHNALSIVPATNLVTNIGESEGATRKKGDKGAQIMNLSTVSISFPLTHPTTLEPNDAADAYSLKHGWRVKTTLREKSLFFFKQYFPTLHRTLKSLKR